MAEGRKFLPNAQQRFKLSTSGLLDNFDFRTRRLAKGVRIHLQPTLSGRRYGTFGLVGTKEAITRQPESRLVCKLTSFVPRITMRAFT